MTHVAKVNHLVGDQIKRIYIFQGDRGLSEDSDLGPGGEKIFSSEELTAIQIESIELEFVTAYLHPDDMIDTVKKKILEHTKWGISTAELYLFGMQEKVVNPAVVYNQLTQGDTLDLTRERLCQYLLNIIKCGCSELRTDTECSIFLSEKKDIYDFDDLLALQDIDWTEGMTLTIPIGHKMVIKKRYPFIANPYNCTVMDRVIRRQANNIVTTQNSNLLFEYGPLCNDNLFLCQAGEVLRYADTLDDLSQSNFLSVYFPNLVYKYKITSLEMLRQKRLELQIAEKKQMGQGFKEYNDRVDLFYNMFFSRKDNLDYTGGSPGITDIQFTIHPKYTIHFPLELLFKLIQSTQAIPMIKYNPGRNRENIYRLFTANATATNGKKIPYLYTTNGDKKGKIIQLSRKMARRKRVAFYIQTVWEGKEYEVHCTFEDNGNINVNITPDHPISAQTVEAVVKTAINIPILQKIKSYLEQSGYNYILFENLSDDNIEIRSITYITSLQVRKNIHLDRYKGCISSIFNILEGDLTADKNMIRLQYKRVSNYNELDSIEAFINHAHRLGTGVSEILRDIQTNFQLDSEQAQLRFANWTSQVRAERDLFENKQFTVRTNTGFPVSIIRNRSNFNTSVRIEGINSIHYLPLLNIYIGGLLRLVVDRKGTGVSERSINRLCKGGAMKDLEAEEDVQAEGEKGPSEGRAAPIQYEGAADDFLDMFGFEEEEELEGDLDEEIIFGDVIEMETPIDSTPSPASMTPSPAADALSPLPPSPRSGTTGLDSQSPRSDITSEMEVDLKGIILKGNNNIFMRKKLELQPDLFLKKKEGRFKAYSKACPTQYAKQPIILTTQEKNYIDQQDKTHGTKSYDTSITYGTGDTPYHYICPRFWCLYDKEGKQRSLSLKDINEGECGGWDALIPPTASKIPDGKRIYQFTDTRFHKEGVATKNPLVYKPMWPGFMDPSKHPDNLCIPCCFTRPTHPPPPWEQLHDKKKKPTYRNTETGDTTKHIPPTPLEGYMYKPEGDGGPVQGGIGPSFKRDTHGNIILSSIVGTKQLRESAAKKRGDTYAECSQEEGRTVVSAKTRPSVKAGEIPLLEAWPLGMGQLGYLPIPVQKFLGYDCQVICQRTLTDRRLRQGQVCLLHKGMEKSENQSFLACIADVYGEVVGGENLEERPASRTPLRTIRNIKRIILDHLTIDNFITFQNGNLVRLFRSVGEVPPSTRPYQDSVLFQSLQGTLEQNELLPYFQQIVSAFERFREYLQDEAITINYEYLWDIICTPNTPEGNGGLFPGGLNLVILHSPDDDITNKIELICPTNHYSSQTFDVTRKILILYARDGYFEPIYRYTYIARNKYIIKKLFYLPTVRQSMPELSRVLGRILDDLQSKCRPLPSMPIKYNQAMDFRTNIQFSLIKEELDKGQLPYRFKKQIMNFNSKVIGCLAVNPSDPTDTIYIPSQPSALDLSLEYEYIGAPTMWVTYRQTVERLRVIHKGSGGRIPSNPALKMVSDNVIVGVLTQTNQFVPCLPEAYQEGPEGQEPDGVPAIHLDSTNPKLNILANDQKQLVSTEIDVERIKKVKEIRLESHFYNIFRNLLRILLTYFENKDQKNQILAKVQSVTIPYLDKLGQVEEALVNIMTPYLDFVEYPAGDLQSLEEIGTCLGLSNETCGKEGQCSFSREEGGVCRLQIPNTNLISGGDNYIQYFGRLADELIRYSRIRTFIFNPQKFLSFQQISYKLGPDEIILLEGLLYGAYFEGLVPVAKNPYVSAQDTYDSVEPSQSVPYVTTYTWPPGQRHEGLNPCVVAKGKQTLKLGYWAAHGLDRYAISQFKSGSFRCSWELIKDIINMERMGEAGVVLGDILVTLTSRYAALFADGLRREILQIMKMEGKVDQASALSEGNAIENIITLDNYYLTTLDFFLLSRAYQLPVILLCRTNIRGMNSKSLSFLEPEARYCYIILMAALAPTANSNRSPQYGLIHKNLSIRLQADSLGDAFTAMTTLPIRDMNQFLARIKQTVLKKVVVKKVKGRIRLGR